MTSIDFYRNVADVDQVIAEQEQVATQCASLYLVRLACKEYNTVTIKHDNKHGRNTFIRAQHELELYSTYQDNDLSSSNDVEKSNADSKIGETFKRLINLATNAMINNEYNLKNGKDLQERTIQHMKHLLNFFSIDWLNDDTCKILLQKSIVHNKNDKMEDHLTRILILILELTSPESDLPLLLFSEKLKNFAKSKFLLSLLNKQIEKSKEGGGTFLAGEKGKTFLKDEIAVYTKASQANLKIEKSAGESFPLNASDVATFEACYDKMEELPMHVLNVQIPLLMSKFKRNTRNFTGTDSRELTKLMKVSSNDNMDDVKFRKLIISRARTVQSRWQNIYPLFSSSNENEPPVNVTIASIAKSMAITANGGHGNIVVGLSIRGPPTKINIQSNETKE